jgi:hypothetical protein
MRTPVSASPRDSRRATHDSGTEVAQRARKGTVATEDTAAIQAAGQHNSRLLCCVGLAPFTPCRVFRRPQVLNLKGFRFKTAVSDPRDCAAPHRIRNVGSALHAVGRVGCCAPGGSRASPHVQVELRGSAGRINAELAISGANSIRPGDSGGRNRTPRLTLPNS